MLIVERLLRGQLIRFALFDSFPLQILTAYFAPGHSAIIYHGICISPPAIEDALPTH